jgi:hypothetical protein
MALRSAFCFRGRYGVSDDSIVRTTGKFRSDRIYVQTKQIYIRISWIVGVPNARR